MLKPQTVMHVVGEMRNRVDQHEKKTESNKVQTLSL